MTRPPMTRPETLGEQKAAGSGLVVLVCGGRDFVDYGRVAEVLDELHKRTPIATIIEGGASGADHCGALWAKANGLMCVRFGADWATHGKAAGYLRNQRMLDEGKPDLVVAFPGGKGTADMIRRATKAGVRVLDAATPTDAGRGQR